jgi:sRNA-binding carbon storage regulator CsrA
MLTLKPGQSVRLGGDFEVKVLAVRGDRVKFRVSSPTGVAVCPSEVIRKLSAAATQALAAVVAPTGNPP